MSINEELSEQAEKAKRPFERNVAVSMAIIAAGLAVVSVLGQVSANEELLAQQRASDQWAYYQAKSIRRYESDIAKDIFKNMAGAPAAAVEKYAGNMEKYQKDEEDIQREAKQLEAESKLHGRKALRLHSSEVFMEIGIVLASLAILTQRKMAWTGSILSACTGVAIALSTLVIT